MTANRAGYSQASRPSRRLLGMKRSSAWRRSRGGWSSKVICSCPSPSQRTSGAIPPTAAAQPRWLRTVVRLTMSASYLRLRRGQSARTACSQVHWTRSAKAPAGSLTSSAAGSRPPGALGQVEPGHLRRDGPYPGQFLLERDVAGARGHAEVNREPLAGPHGLGQGRANGSALIRSRNAWLCRASQSRSHGWGLRAASTPSALTVSVSGEVTNRLAASTSALTSQRPCFASRRNSRCLLGRRASWPAVTDTGRSGHAGFRPSAPALPGAAAPSGTVSSG